MSSYSSNLEVQKKNLLLAVQLQPPSARRLQCPSKHPADHTLHLLSAGSIPCFGFSCKEDPLKPLHIYIQSNYFIVFEILQWQIFLHSESCSS